MLGEGGREGLGEGVVAGEDLAEGRVEVVSQEKGATGKQAQQQVIGLPDPKPTHQQEPTVEIHTLRVANPTHGIHNISQQQGEILPVQVFVAGKGAVNVERNLVEGVLEDFVTGGEGSVEGGELERTGLEERGEEEQAFPDYALEGG